MSAVPEVWNQNRAIYQKKDTECTKCVFTMLQSVHTQIKI